MFFNQPVHLMRSRHALCNGGKVQTPAEIDNGVQHRRVRPGRRQAVDEYLVNFQVIHRQALKQAQRAVARTKIIHGHLTALLA